MSKWLGYTVELFSNGQWFNIDQWHRHANGELRHRYLYTAPERDIFSSAHEENVQAFEAWLKERENNPQKHGKRKCAQRRKSEM